MICCLLLELAEALGARAFYAAADGPEAALPGLWERLFARAEDAARTHGKCAVLLDEAPLLEDWAGRLEGEWDRLRRRKARVHIVATGSAARFGTWAENACLAYAWNSGQRVTCWREEPHEVDAVL